MLINREEKTNIVECLFKSSNILASEYNETNKKLTVTFNSGLKYEYYDVMHRDYIRFEISESQGSVFNKTMRKYKYQKLEPVDPKPILERLEVIIKGKK